MFLSLRVLLNAMEKQESRSVQTRSGTRDIGRGAIVSIASAHSFVPLPNKVSYITAKHADIGLLKSAGGCFPSFPFSLFKLLAYIRFLEIINSKPC